MSDQSYDAIVIGAGPGGEVCAGALADGGMRVAVMERELVGGECSYWGCIPSKTLLRPGDAREAALEAPGARETVHGDLEVAEVLGWRDYMVGDYDDSGQVPWLADRGIDILRGEARIAERGVVEVAGRRVEADRIVVATGSDAFIPPIDGIATLDGVWTNREVTGAKKIPGHLIVIGGGAIGTEMSQAMRRLGAEVTIIEGGDRLVPREARPVGEAVGRRLTEEGVHVRTGVHVASVAPHNGRGVKVTLDSGLEIEGDKLLVATGRRVRTDGIGLDTVGVEAGRRGIEVDDRLRAAKGVWAIGDVTGVAQFTHVAKYQGRVAAADMLGKKVKADYRAIPRVTFTDPEVASVGDTEGEETGTAQLSAVSRTATYQRTEADRPGFLTVVSDGKKLTGAYAVGPNAGDWLGQATLAIRAEIPLDVLRDTIQPFPTFSEVFFSALSDLGEGDSDCWQRPD